MNESKLFHLGFNPSEINAKYAILPGDPGRTAAIADCFGENRIISCNREYTVRLAHCLGEEVVICSTGIGGPSSAIAVEELYLSGVRTFIRIGTCGAMQQDIKGGDLIVASAAVRQDGTSLQYAPAEFPAVADFEVTGALRDAAMESGRKVYTGVVQSKDSFYGQHSPERMPVAADLQYKWEAWKKLGVLASEMECAAIYTVCAALGAAAGCVLHVIWNQERAAAGLDNPQDEDTSAAVKASARAVELLIERSRK